MAHRRVPSVFADRPFLIGVVVAAIAVPLLLPDSSWWLRIAVMLAVVWSVQWAVARRHGHRPARESGPGGSCRAR